MINNNENPSGKSPDFVAYNVRENAGGKDYWDRVGVAFMHRDGKGVDIRLNAIPTDGHVTLRERAQDFQSQQNERKQGQEQSRSHDPKVD